jgi:hypothetical protein
MRPSAFCTRLAVGTGDGMDKSGRISLKVFSNRISAQTRDAIAERRKATTKHRKNVSSRCHVRSS